MRTIPRAVLAAAAFGAAVTTTGLSAGQPPAAVAATQRVSTFSGSITSVSSKAHELVVRSGSRRVTFDTTSGTRVLLDGQRTELAGLRSGLAVSVRAIRLSSGWRALTIAARTPRHPIGSAPATPQLSAALGDVLAAERYNVATFSNITGRLGEIRPFVNIASNEQQIVVSVTGLMKAYGVGVPAAGKGGGATAPSTRSAACQLGASVERSAIALYRQQLPLVKDYPDVVTVFQNALDAAQSNRLPALVNCS